MHEKRVRNRRLWVIILEMVAIYILVGAIIPYAFHPTVGERWKKDWSVEEFYGENEISVDRAGIIETSQQALNIRLNLLNRAQKEIWIYSFSFKPDRSNQEIFSVVWNAANRGVKVRILADALSAGIDMKRDSLYYAVATHPNVEIRYYNMPSIIEPWSLNARLHDKIVLVDQKYMILGGRNTSNYFLGEYDLNSLSYDREVFIYNTSNRLTGSVLYDVRKYCEDFWNLKSCKQVFSKIPKRKNKKVIQEIQIFNKQYEILQHEQNHILSFSDYNSITTKANKVTFIANPLNVSVKEPVIWYQMIELINHAREKAIIQTPYAILNRSMRNTLKKAGEDLSIFELILNSTDGGDNVVASADYKYAKGKLKGTGIKIYEFEEKHSMHNKSLLIDDDISVIGSFNFDMRSVYLNTESAIVVHGQEFNTLLDKEMERMKYCSYEIRDDGDKIKNDGVVEQKVPLYKEVLYYVVGLLLQPFRFIL